MPQLDASQQILLDRALERMVRSGHAATPQRRLVAQELLASPCALTARQLADRLGAQGDRVGVMTVYRTLALLAEIGAAYVLHDHLSESAEAHYAFCSDRHHHHLICSACWGVWEVEGCGLSEAQVRVGDAWGFQVQSHSLDYYGLCARCATA
ncbi:MAG: Fur family transcriptional regulator [Thermaerobacter sp.]|nr:Fur family transcriptional regulator [Thermaerobacter sp.]